MHNLKFIFLLNDDDKKKKEVYNKLRLSIKQVK
jgi:hypothetical protein